METERQSSGKAIDHILKCGPVSWFKTSGFRKIGRCFYLEHGELIHTANFQANWTNTPDNAKFALNVGVEWPLLHELWTGKAVGKNPAIAPCFISTRLHPQIGWDRDYWWTAVPTSDDRKLGDEIVAALDVFAESFWANYSDLKNVLSQFERGERVPCGNPKRIVWAALLFHFGRKMEGAKVMTESIRKAPGDGEASKMVAKRLGLDIA